MPSYWGNGPDDAVVSAGPQKRQIVVDHGADEVTEVLGRAPPEVCASLARISHQNAGIRRSHKGRIDGHVLVPVSDPDVSERRSDELLTVCAVPVAMT